MKSSLAPWMARSRRWTLALILACALLPLVAAVPAAAAPTFDDDGFEDVVTASGFNQPTAFAYTPDGRMLVTEKQGELRVVAAGAHAPRPTSVIDISDHVNANGDRGLLGLAVDADYTSNHYVYLLYTYDHDPLNPTGEKVSRLTRIKVDLNSNLEAGETTILGTSGLTSCPAPDGDVTNDVDCIPSEYPWHSIGTVKSDPADGTLWVGSGDAQMSLNFQTKTLETQSDESYRGKILHIDRNGNGLTGHPFCPGQPNSRPCSKIYAKGFRNPFRFTLRSGKGPIVGDVGADDREEVDLIQPGGNYGWPCIEGTIHNGIHAAAPVCQALYAQEATAAKPPIWDYQHTGGNAIAGGPKYTGVEYPSPYRGDIFVADFAGGWFKRLKVDSNDELQSVQPFAEFGPGGGSPVDIEMTPQGEIAYLDIGYTANDDGVHRIRWKAGNATPVARATGSPLAGGAPLHVSFDASGSTDADGDTLSYAWDFGDGQTGSGAQVSHTYASPTTNYTATVTVTDGRGGSSTATVGPITPGNHAPVATVDAPATFRYGDSITVHGAATDAEDGALAPARLKWRVLQQHGNHTHPFSDFTGPDVTFATGDDHDADSYFKVTLTATDARGATDVRTVEIRPETVAFTLASRPAGIPLTYGTATAIGPDTRRSAIGFAATIGAPASAQVGGVDYDFLGWSDGGGLQHQIAIPAADTTLTATYNGRPAAAIDAQPGAEDFEVALSAGASRDPDGDGLSYSWDLGDGTKADGPSVAHRFAGAGDRSVRLTVTDPHGAAATAERTVTPAPAVRPLVRFSLPRSGARMSAAGVLSLAVTNPGAATTIGSLALTTKKAIRVGRARAKRVKIADAAFIVAPHGKRTLRIKLSKANRKLVAKLRSVPVVVSWKAQDRGAHRKASGRSNWKLLAPKRKR